MDNKTEEKDIIRIKRTRGYVPLFLMLSIVLFALSLYCIIYAYNSNLNGTSATIFYIAGLVGTLFFAYSTFDNLFQTLQPKNALVIGEEGFADFTVGGVGIGVIKWTNISSVKTVRSKDGRLLMITLSDLMEVLDEAPKSAQKAVLSSNWEANSIAIRQIDVSERLENIITIFKRHIERANAIAEEASNAEENSKTKIMSDADVKSLFKAITEQEEIKLAEAVEKDEKSNEEGDENADNVTDFSETTAIPDLASEFDKEKVYEQPKEEPEPEIINEAKEALSDSEYGNENNPADKEEKASESVIAPEEAPKNTSTEQDILNDIDDIIKTSEKRKRHDADLDDLMTKFADELKSGKKKLSDSERDTLTEELTAMLADIKKKKSNN